MMEMGPGAVSGIGWGAHRERSPFSLPTPTLPTRLLTIGVLRGSWREMGIQYGERAAGDIAQHWDVDWEDRVIACTGQWAQSRTPADRQAYRLQYLQRSWQELETLSPQLCEFMRGVAEGAAAELAAAHHGPDLPGHLKVLYLNESDAAVHPSWDFAADRPGPAGPEVAGADSYVDDHDNQGDGCNGFWISGSRTENGHALAQRAVQAGMNRSVTVVSYVAVPDDPAAQVFWAAGRAGCLGGLGAMMNESGVCLLTSGSQGGAVDETLAPGVKDFILGAYGVIFHRSAGAAARGVTVGPASYREATGRDTVLRFRGANLVFGDPQGAVAVESNARHFWLRGAGDHGCPEATDEGDYLVIANHFVGTASYDENMVLHEDQPMSDYVPGRAGSASRYWTGHWWLREHGRPMTVADAKALAVTHDSYDREGTFQPVDPVTGRQLQAEETWCAHKFDDGAVGAPLGTDGNNITTVYDLHARQAWFVLGWPCHYPAWHMEWNQVDLDDYRR